MAFFDFAYFLFGGLVYLSSPTFREKKRREWNSRSMLYKMYEIAMWVFLPAVTLFIATMLCLS
ncbi:MAG: hypothetical protein CO186_10815 [Zetaproteobacteria bacterium CG_4_9_14_3_um_filter_49_83]|nr:MAG: hypothetical protein AUJ56_09205 [Zetaproteobacteria bacterium CG1_02_49_23]PIQ33339.1 MAG: hypothetical protein COW62_05720 [Zetaproteobacteria bacterium CG17_big_fil_post_rev_8_21_14_2_50_50_13]PIV31056.1 MAG: hypothetical protein COS35_03380 [Zetaproteobacteria bacterium CG02_land_8_20_14_3_00_50_9]PIY57075.1 MAG: hypothetical protein COZ00_00900 [Zetaproteobacteria bacterium CG_4_10_14_0_8_um_filter_49_80]PJA34385.1 MAG: hypothetical protein CO186_10815 [Zetaproteobacteria bacterium